MRVKVAARREGLSGFWGRRKVSSGWEREPKIPRQKQGTAASVWRR